MSEDAMIKDLLRQIPLFQSVFRDFVGPSSNPLASSPATVTAAVSRSNLVPTSDQEDLFFCDLAKDIRLRTFSPGDVIVQEGEPAKCVFFIFRGSVEVVSSDGELVLGALDAGSYFGEIAVLFDTPRVATVRCLAKCLLGVLTSSDLHLQLAKYPKMKDAVLSEAKERYNKSRSVLLERQKRGGVGGGGDDLGNLTVRTMLSQDSLLERKISMLDIGRSLSSPKGIESPTGRRNSSLGTSMSLPTPEMIAALSQKAAENAQKGIEEENDDSEDDLPEVPCIQINPELPPKQQQTPQTQQQEDQQRQTASKGLEKQESDSLEVDHRGSNSNSNIKTAGTGLDIPANSYVASLALLNTTKRRASVAVWSDDNLMKLAQSAAEKTSPKTSATPNRGGSGLSNPKRSITSPLQSESSEISIDYRPSACEDEKRIFPTFPNDTSILILKYLDPRRLMRLRILSHGVTRVLEDPRHFFFESVDLSPWHKKIDDATLLKILKFCGHAIKSLNLRNCWQVTDKGLLSIAELAPCVEFINLASVWDVTDAGVGGFAKLASNLHCIDLSNCRKLTDAAVLAVLAFSPNLEDIHLSYCKNLTDTSMDHATWSTVKSINMQRCTAISDGGFLTWASSASTPFQLTELILSDCSFLTDAAVTNISLVCPNLQLLSLSFCCALTEACVEPLTKACAGLRVLDMSFCGSAVTDSSLQKISENSKELERLSVRGCVLITNAGVSALRGLGRMKMINMTQCRNVTIPANELKSFGWVLLNGGELVTDGFREQRWGVKQGDRGLKSVAGQHSRALTT
ncbi:hypothetical protein BDR26DRAFT_857070 [Obelidium mucronatum]|nr:hypothetical protein BDR26DRAFT_857070 [Obelidium mucronatum]